MVLDSGLLFWATLYVVEPFSCSRLIADDVHRTIGRNRQSRDRHRGHCHWIVVVMGMRLSDVVELIMKTHRHVVGIIIMWRNADLKCGNLKFRMPTVNYMLNGKSCKNLILFVFYFFQLLNSDFIIYKVVQKWHTFCAPSNFLKYWQIFKLFTLTESRENL